MTTYAWTIDRDHLAEEFGNLPQTPTGPRSAPDTLVAKLEAGKGQKFRLLDDFGTHTDGAPEIQYHLQGRWTGL